MKHYTTLQFVRNTYKVKCTVRPDRLWPSIIHEHGRARNEPLFYDAPATVFTPSGTSSVLSQSLLMDHEFVLGYRLYLEFPFLT